jgi:outer membrane protein W
MMRHTSIGIALAAVVILTSAAPVQAQDGFWWGVTYQAAQPAETTTDLIDTFSWRNIGFDGRAFFGPNVSAGLFVGWNVFHDDPEGLVSIGGVDVSGRQNRYINAFPILATAHYYLGLGESDSRLFIGTGLGTYYIENRLDIGRSSLTADNWHFGLAPEVGVTLPFSRDFHGVVSVKYNRAFEAGDVEHSYWTFGIGLGGLVSTR